ncbi:metallophosphatase family protein [Butyrivibrio sp. DSM 10294]|uniref:metallophosphoesterase family protein n=1 Tax=Butyrivibrio sp. DSM 10294 TaxID=2972457 RepID=UPI00234F63FE|nr:metallophosphoesterase family protein [Butyrivibrio sp. DSM 10294]MDC7292596.1 metallophosphatase family protein [Butyrivibrio sp. DSM 10294]
MRIGILSDTHGLLRQEVFDAFKGVDHIIHAGDIDNKAVIDRLEEIAPVTVVRGNADKEWAEYLQEIAILEFLGNKIYVIHNKGKIHDDLTGISIIIYGHSHKYSLVEKDGQVWFNPGCCGKRKPEQEVSFALLEISGPGEFEFRKRVIDNSGQDSRLPKDIDRIISKTMDMTDKGKTHKEIAKKLKISEELAESICRMYLTHPGVDVAGILQRIS